MKKLLYLLILLNVFLPRKAFCQALPPVINSYTDTVGTNSLVLYLNYTANDTGLIKAQIQLQHGAGDNDYDSTYSFTAPAADTGTVQLNIPSLLPCYSYSLLINMRNDAAQGTVTNPLFTFTTLCTAAITPVNENSYAFIAYNSGIEIKTTQPPVNGLIDVYDLAGRLVLSTPFNQPVQQIPFNQNAGIYLLRITGNGQALYTNRFVIY